MGAVFTCVVTGAVIIEGVRVGIAERIRALLEHFLNLCAEIGRICLDFSELFPGEVIDLSESSNAVKIASVFHPFQSDLHHAGVGRTAAGHERGIDKIGIRPQTGWRERKQNRHIFPVTEDIQMAHILARLAFARISLAVCAGAVLIQLAHSAGPAGCAAPADTVNGRAERRNAVVIFRSFRPIGACLVAVNDNAFNHFGVVGIFRIVAGYFKLQRPASRNFDPLKAQLQASVIIGKIFAAEIAFQHFGQGKIFGFYHCIFIVVSHNSFSFFVSITLRFD